MNRQEMISRIRNTIKEVHADSEYSNRYLWNLIVSSAKKLIREDADRGRIFKQASIWETICIEMEPVSSLICNCRYLPYNCIVYRSKNKLPDFLEYSAGVVYRFIATPDLSKEMVLVSPYQYSVKKNIKYNKEKYAFIHDGYLYTPNTNYPLLSMSSLFLEDVSLFKCDSSIDTSACGSVLTLNLPLPDYLEDNCVKIVLQELGFSKQIVSDQHPNSNENQREGTP